DPLECHVEEVILIDDISRFGDRGRSYYRQQLSDEVRIDCNDAIYPSTSLLAQKRFRLASRGRKVRRPVRVSQLPATQVKCCGQGRWWRDARNDFINRVRVHRFVW